MKYLWLVSLVLCFAGLCVGVFFAPAVWATAFGVVLAVIYEIFENFEENS